MERIRLLLSKYYADQASREEMEEMLRWLQDHRHNAQLLQEVWEAEAPEAPAAALEGLWARIELETAPAGQPQSPAIKHPAQVRPLRRQWWWAAAAAIILLSAGTWLLNSQHEAAKTPAISSASPAPDIAPGRNGAVLT